MTKHKKIIWLISILAIAGLAFYFTSQLDKPARGGKQFGGELHLAIKGERSVLNPLASNTLDHHRVQQLIFEPLITPADNERGWDYLLAKKIKVSADCKTIFIEIRKNVRFAPDPCFRLSSDQLNASDVAFSLSMACSADKRIQKNDGLAKLIKDIVVLDDNKLKVRLHAPYNHFIKMLCGPAFGMMSKVASKYYKAGFFKHPVGTGPFQLTKSGSAFAEFCANPNYWRKDKFGNQLPYLDKVKVLYDISGARAQQLFLQNKIDLLFDLPVDDLQEAFGTLADARLGKNPLHEVYIKNAAKIHFIQFDCTQKPFDNPALRKALALAIDTKTICTEVLKGEGLPLEGYFIPDGKRNKWQQNLASDFQKQLVAARAAYALAGYGPDHPLPAIYFYVGAPKNTLAFRWAKAVAQMLQKYLWVRVLLREEILEVPTKNSVCRSGWVGDYPGAETYLRLFYSGAQQPLLFKNTKVDNLYLASILAKSSQEKARYEQACEQEILRQQALIPIYTEGFIVLNQLHLRGLVLDQVGLVEYAKLFFKELKPI